MDVYLSYMPADDRPAVILVDMQKEWLMEESPYYLGEASIFKKKAETLADEALQRGLPLVYTRRHMRAGMEGTFNPYDERSHLIDRLPGDDSIELIDHSSWNPFIATFLMDFLDQHNVSRVVVGGMAINAGVRATVAYAYDQGMDVTLVKDCCLADTSRVLQSTVEDLLSYREIEIDVLRNFPTYL